VPRRRLARLSTNTVDLPIAEGGELPREFRLFRAGENETTKGTFVFDAKAADLVLSSAAQHGVDLMLDLEHLSIDDDAPNFDPDARAWFRLEVRNGELWAVDVRWTPDGARRLNERTQRYVSPAFLTDDEGRVTEIVNVALVAMPATHGTPALIAAGRRRRMNLKDRINALSARLSIARGKITKLADDGASDGEDVAKGKGAQLKSAAEAAASAIEELQNAAGGNDMDATFAAMESAQSAIDALEKALAAFGVQDSPSESGPAPAPEQNASQPDDAQKMARQEAKIIALQREIAKRDHDAQVAKLAAEAEERTVLEGELVKLGRETPASVKLLSGLSLADIRKRVEMFRSAKGVQLGRSPQAPVEGSNVMVTGPIVELSDYEVSRVKAYAEKRAAEVKAANGTPREVDEVLSRYVGHREQQFRGAKTDHMVRMLGRRIEQEHVLLSRDGRMVTLATTPVKPIEEFGQSSQRALEEFRMNYNMALAAEPKVWAETLGDVMPSGSVSKDTYPINLMAARYVKKTAQNAAAETALNFDISVTKDEYVMAEEVELRRLLGGDFAYVLNWNRRAERAARARVWLRNQLVTTILEAGESGYWGSSTELATGIDGMPFFSATHKVHPRDPSRKLRGVATWSNLQSAAKPLTSANLVAEKPYAFSVSDPTGHEFGFEYDAMLVPSSLNETARNLLTVQDLILDAANPIAGVAVNGFAAVKNPHYMSGMEYVRGPELAGTDTTADWYLVSRAALAAGLYPWLISEDGSEELRTWDESSDHYKNSGMIKVESHVYSAAALLFPHGIRKVSGT
jgi:phage I-like protein